MRRHSEDDRVEHGAKALDDVVGHDRLDVLLQVLFRIYLANLHKQESQKEETTRRKDCEYVVGVGCREDAFDRISVNMDCNGSDCI